jgi:hypothetical protein
VQNACCFLLEVNDARLPASGCVHLSDSDFTLDISSGRRERQREN